MGVLVFSLRKQFRAAGIPIACHHSHTQALWIYLIFGSKCQARFIPLGYFTNNLFLIRASPPQLVIKDPINGTEKGEAFKEWRQLFFSVRENPFVLLSRTLVLWLLFNSVFPLFLLQISKKKKKEHNERWREWQKYHCVSTQSGSYQLESRVQGDKKRRCLTETTSKRI